MIDGPLGGPVVREWLDSLREQFEHDVVELRATAGLAVRVRSAPLGSHSDFQGHEARIDVTLADGESLTLAVTAAYLTTEPRIYADVSWSHGNVVACTWDAEWSAEWPVATRSHIDHLQRDLPRLVAALHDAIARGRRGTRSEGGPLASRGS